MAKWAPATLLGVFHWPLISYQEPVTTPGRKKDILLPRRPGSCLGEGDGHARTPPERGRLGGSVKRRTARKGAPASSFEPLEGGLVGEGEWRDSQTPGARLPPPPKAPGPSLVQQQPQLKPGAACKAGEGRGEEGGLWRGDVISNRGGGWRLLVEGMCRLPPPSPPPARGSGGCSLPSCPAPGISLGSRRLRKLQPFAAGSAGRAVVL